MPKKTTIVITSYTGDLTTREIVELIPTKMSDSGGGFALHDRDGAYDVFVDITEEDI
ncbi:hypothetical protein SEA_ANON_83 [Gordonia phage Anon]|nr:hypothetical protein SEA_ANON_83 [Gordonia phage Anon]